LWYAQSNTLEPVFVPIEEGVMSREHIAVAEHKDERISAFVESLSGQDRDLSIDFRDNCLRRVDGGTVRAEVRQRVLESLPGGVGG
jgi:hypothetical protein